MEIGTFEAKTRFSALLDQVEKGQEITITRRGRAVARLVPALSDPGARLAEKRAAVQWIKQFRESHTTGGDDVKDWIEEGRR